MWKIPLSELEIGDDEIEAVTRVLRSKWLTMGEVTQQFEREFAEFVGVKHAFAVTNCTVALQLAYRILGVGNGDEFILPSLTFVATANAGVVEGGAPIFADVTSEEDLTISAVDVERKITANTKAITVVHYAGHACDMERILDIARNRGIAVIEDCAHSPGATYRGERSGAMGDVGCFSFFSNKNIATGEGGMITTNRDDLAERIRLLRSHGMTTLTLERHKGHSFTYDVVDAGYNFRIDEMRAAIGLTQLRAVRERNERRRELFAQYRRALAEVDVSIPFANRPVSESVFHIMPVLLPAGCDRRSFMEVLKGEGVQTSIHYPPIHTFDFYARRGSVHVPVTEQISPRLVTLPMYPSMTQGDVGHVAASARIAIEAATRV